MKLNTKSLSEVEIGIPVLAAGIYHAKIRKPELKDNKAGTGQNLVVTVTILEEAVTTSDGKQVTNRGQCVCTRYISLVPSVKYDPDQAIKELAVAIGHPADQNLELSDLEGKTCMVNLEVQVAGEYPESNWIKRFTKWKDDDAFNPPVY